MENLNVRRITGALILYGLIVLPCYSQRANPNGEPDKRKRIIVEIAIKEFGGLQRFELPLAAGAGRGGGGGTSSPVNITGYVFGLSILELRTREALLSLTMTLTFVGGTEKKIDERFLVPHGEKKEYEFAYGVKVKSYFKEKRAGRKRKGSTFGGLQRERYLQEGIVTASALIENGHNEI
jgi:hypothetical protein